MRQNRGAMICPECGKLIGVDEPRCPFCGAWRPGLFGLAPRLQQVFGRRLDLSRIIVGACIALYAISLVLQPGGIYLGFASPFNFLAPGYGALLKLGETGGQAWQHGWWWTLFTAGWLHGSLLHIFFNMLWLRNLVPGATEAYGPARTFVIFSLSSAVGFLVSNLATGAPTIGASAGIFGLLGALIVYARRTGHPIAQQLWYWAAYMFVFGFIMRGVNNWAHAGGFVGGWVLGETMRGIEDKRESVAVQLVALAVAVITLCGFALSFMRVVLGG